MKNRACRDHPEKGKANDSIRMKMKKKKNITRLGGHGLSLEAFANAKSTSNHYNPALIKQQKEFYKNAKYLSKFKRKLKQQNQQNDFSSAARLLVDVNGTAEASKMIKKNKNKKGSNSLRALYEKQHEEKEKARMEREAIINAKKEAKEKAETHRKAEKQKMFKRTRHGQPVMKYKIEHLLQIIQGSN